MTANLLIEAVMVASLGAVVIIVIYQVAGYFILKVRGPSTEVDVMFSDDAGGAVGGAVAKAPPKKSIISITRVEVIYALTMVVGILGKEIWDSINETGKVMIRLERIIAAIIVSPIVYAAVYSQFPLSTITLPGLAIAFQNGFFWQAVFSTAQAGSSATP